MKTILYIFLVGAISFGTLAKRIDKNLDSSDSKKYLDCDLAYSYGGKGDHIDCQRICNQYIGSESNWINKSQETCSLDLGPVEYIRSTKNHPRFCMFVESELWRKYQCTFRFERVYTSRISPPEWYLADIRGCEDVESSVNRNLKSCHNECVSMFGGLNEWGFYPKLVVTRNIAGAELSMTVAESKLWRLEADPYYYNFICKPKDDRIPKPTPKPVIDPTVGPKPVTVAPKPIKPTKPVVIPTKKPSPIGPTDFCIGDDCDPYDNLSSAFRLSGLTVLAIFSAIYLA